MARERFLNAISIVCFGFAAGCSNSDDANGTGGTAGASGSSGSGGSSAADGASGAGGAGPWSCVGHVVYPQAPAASLDVTRRFYHMPAKYGDPADGAPYAGATIDACDAQGDCAAPLDTAVTDANGDAALTLPTPGIGFEGYLRLTGPDVVPSVLYMLPPIADASSRYLASDWIPAVLTTTSLAGFASAQGVSIDASAGQVVGTIMDCDEAFSEVPVMTANGTTADTSGGGDSVFFNVEPGPVELVAKLADGTEVGRVTRTVAAGELLGVNFGPTP